MRYTHTDEPGVIVMPTKRLTFKPLTVDYGRQRQADERAARKAPLPLHRRLTAWLRRQTAWRPRSWNQMTVEQKLYASNIIKDR